MKISSKYLHSQNVTAKDLKFERRFTSPQFSRVMSQMSSVTYQLSHVTCHIFLLIFFFFNIGEASRWRVCYQQGLPRLVFLNSLLSLVMATSTISSPSNGSSSIFIIFHQGLYCPNYQTEVLVSNMFSTIATIPKNTACLSSLFPMVCPLYFLVLKLNVAPPLT